MENTKRHFTQGNSFELRGDGIQVNLLVPYDAKDSLTVDLMLGNKPHNLTKIHVDKISMGAWVTGTLSRAEDGGVTLISVLIPDVEDPGPDGEPAIHFSTVGVKTINNGSLRGTLSGLDQAYTIYTLAGIARAHSQWERFKAM